MNSLRQRNHEYGYSQVSEWRPKAMFKALRQLLTSSLVYADPDTQLPIMAATLRSMAAHIELMKVEQLGGSLAISGSITVTEAMPKACFWLKQRPTIPRLRGRIAH